MIMYDIPKHFFIADAYTSDERYFQYLNSISSEDWKLDLDFGIESINRQKR